MDTEIDRLRAELASAQTIAARESAEADVQVESRIEAQEELSTARTEIETLRKRIVELQEQAEFHIKLLTGGGSAAYLGELAEAYRLRDFHHTDAIDARLETESLRDELAEAKARIAELDGQNQQMFTASCNLANDLQTARERIAELQGGAERYWEGRWRDEHTGNAGLLARIAELERWAKLYVETLDRAERAEAERDAFRTLVQHFVWAIEDRPGYGLQLQMIKARAALAGREG